MKADISYFRSFALLVGLSLMHLPEVFSNSPTFDITSDQMKVDCSCFRPFALPAGLSLMYPLALFTNPSFSFT